uniref:Uncharacterized protein n=1 Tax=Steinernema glaseri TaxID=37863 RepID=A0A1I8AHB0_9BILA
MVKNPTKRLPPYVSIVLPMLVSLTLRPHLLPYSAPQFQELSTSLGIRSFITRDLFVHFLFACGFSSSASGGEGAQMSRIRSVSDAHVGSSGSSSFRGAQMLPSEGKMPPGRVPMAPKTPPLECLGVSTLGVSSGGGAGLVVAGDRVAGGHERKGSKEVTAFL